MGIIVNKFIESVPALYAGWESFKKMYEVNEFSKHQNFYIYWAIQILFSLTIFICIVSVLYGVDIFKFSMLHHFQFRIVSFSIIFTLMHFITLEFLPHHTQYKKKISDKYDAMERSYYVKIIGFTSMSALGLYCGFHELHELFESISKMSQGR